MQQQHKNTWQGHYNKYIPFKKDALMRTANPLNAGNKSTISAQLIALILLD